MTVRAYGSHRGRAFAGDPGAREDSVRVGVRRGRRARGWGRGEEVTHADGAAGGGCCAPLRPCCSILVLGAGAVHLAPQGSALAAWWPSAGVAVAFLATTPAGRWAGFLAALGVVVALAAVLGGRALGVAVALGAANAASAGVAIAVLARRTPGRVRLRSLEDLWVLVLATLLGGAVAGVLIGGTLRGGPGSPFWATAVTVMASSSASVLLVSPLGMDVSVAPVDSGRLERTAQLVLGLGVLLLVFGPDQQLPLDFLPIPLLMWGAMRLPLRAVTVELLLVGVVTSVATSLGHGPIAHDLVQDGLRPETVTGLVQTYLATIALVVLPLALAGAQRREALGPRGRRRGALPARLQRLADRDAAAAGHSRRPGRRRGEHRRRRAARLRRRRAARPAVGQRPHPRRTARDGRGLRPRSCPVARTAGCVRCGWPGRGALGPARGLRARAPRRRADAQRPARRPDRAAPGAAVPRGRAGLHRRDPRHHQHPDHRARPARPGWCASTRPPRR